MSASVEESRQADPIVRVRDYPEGFVAQATKLGDPKLDELLQGGANNKRVEDCLRSLRQNLSDMPVMTRSEIDKFNDRQRIIDRLLVDMLYPTAEDFGFSR